MLYRKHLTEPSEHVKYISSVKDDVEILNDVVRVFKAHVEHLVELGLIQAEVGKSVLECLDRFDVGMLGEEYEDVHEALEDFLVKCSGEAGKWVGLGRSRNDHVAAAIRLRLVRYLGELKDSIRRLRCMLLKLSAESADWIVPCYTHGLPAQPSTLGHYLLAIDEALGDHAIMLDEVEHVVGKSPLGSGACGGTTVPLDREGLSRRLGFKGLVENTIYATSSRGFINLTLGVVASLAVELSRFVEDLIKWSSPDVGFVEPHEAHLSTSSIMPHKRNPVTLEVLRARLGEMIGDYVATLTIQRSLGFGYYLDLQEVTRHLWASVKVLIEGVNVLADFLARAKFRRERMEEAALKHPITSFHLVEILSTSQRRPYRDAYFDVAKELRDGKILLPYPSNTIRECRVLGGPNPSEVRRVAAKRAEELGCT